MVSWDNKRMPWSVIPSAQLSLPSQPQLHLHAANSMARFDLGGLAVLPITSFLAWLVWYGMVSGLLHNWSLGCRCRCQWRSPMMLPSLAAIWRHLREKVRRNIFPRFFWLIVWLPQSFPYHKAAWLIKWWPLHPLQHPVSRSSSPGCVHRPVGLLRGGCIHRITLGHGHHRQA